MGYTNIHGVFQGSNFGQTFFSIYFNDTLNVLEHMTGYLLADDSQAHLEVDFDKINEGISKVDFVSRCGMALNKNTSNVMIIGLNRINFDIIDGGVSGGEQVEFCKSIKNLGVIFDSSINFEEHNNEKLQDVHGVLSRIRHTWHTIPNYLKRDIACPVIDSILSYVDVISYDWGAHGTIDQENRIRIADNNRIRYIFGLKTSEHISEYRKQINGLTPKSKAKLHSATLITNKLKRAALLV